MSKVLQERGFGSLPSSTEANPRDQVKSISTTIEADSCPIRRIGSNQYAVSTGQNRTLMYETRQMTILFPSHLNGYYCEEKKGSYGPQFSEAHSEASHINNSIPRKEKNPGSFTLPCFINNFCFDNALVDLGDSSASGHVYSVQARYGECAVLFRTRARLLENQVMAISVISISLDSSEDSVGTPAGRVILFETPIIAPNILPSPDYTPASPDYSHASDSESDLLEDPSSDHIPPLPAISPILSSDDDTTDSDTPDTPPSPTHGTPFTEITASTQRSPIIPRRRVMILSPG
ncbi:hypothetical protein Tco_1410951 [Tanacetum coccineum]